MALIDVHAFITSRPRGQECRKSRHLHNLKKHLSLPEPRGDSVQIQYLGYRVAEAATAGAAPAVPGARIRRLHEDHPNLGK